MSRIITLTETTDPTAVADQAVLYSKDVTGVTQLFVRVSDGTIAQLSGISTASPIVVWTAAKTWSQVYTEIASFNSKCVVLIEPSGANRNITTGTYDINGVRFIGMPQLNTASTAYGAVKVNVDAAVTFTQDGTTLFAVISSQDVFWYFDAAVQPVQQDKIRIRLDGGKMHADSGSVFTGITEARIFLTGGAHIQGYSGAADSLIQLADAATCVIESYGGRVMQNIINTPGTAFSATVTLWTDPASVVYTSGTGGWFRSANTTPTYNSFWSSSATPGGSANALAMVASDGSFHKVSVDASGNWNNVADAAIGDPVASGTAGSVLFIGAGPDLQQDNTNLFWDDTNDRLGVGTNVPDATIDVRGVTQLVGAVNVIASTLTTTGGGSVHSSGEVRTDTIQHYTSPGGTTPIEMMVPLNTHGGRLKIYGTTSNTDGQIYLDPVDSGGGPSLGFGFGTNAAVTGYINDKGYQAGVTQFRNLEIRDGKGAQIAFFDGATKASVIGGSGALPPANSVAIVGGLEVYASASEDIFFGANRETFWMGGGGATSMGTNYNTNGAATMYVNDVGYLGGITQFRNLQINDGKGTTVALFTGSTKRTDLSGAIGQKAHAAFAGSDRVATTAAVQTTDATQTTLFTLALPDTSDTVIEARVVGRGTAGVERSVYGKVALVYREGGGATIQGSVQDVFSDIETTAGLDATITVSSNDVRVSVTGLAATTINWVASITYQTVSGNA